MGRGAGPERKDSPSQTKAVETKTAPTPKVAPPWGWRWVEQDEILKQGDCQYQTGWKIEERLPIKMSIGLNWLLGKYQIIRPLTPGEKALLSL